MQFFTYLLAAFAISILLIEIKVYYYAKTYNRSKVENR